MRYTKFRHRLYAVGGNSEAAFVYMINGVLCSLSAMLVLSRFSTANYNMSLGYEMETITACVVGGISLSGTPQVEYTEGTIKLLASSNFAEYTDWNMEVQVSRYQSKLKEPNLLN
jgi:ABC-type glucose/galactose transport system permease subunit